MSQTIQILSTGAIGKTPAQLQVGNQTYTSGLGSDLTSGFFIYQLAPGMPAYWSSQGSNIFTNASTPTGLQPVNGQAYCVLNSTSSPIAFATALVTYPPTLTSDPAPVIIPRGGSASFVFNSLASTSKQIPITYGFNPCPAAPGPSPSPTPSPSPSPSPTPSPSPASSFFQNHKTLIIILIIIGVVVALLIISFLIARTTGEKMGEKMEPNQQLLTSQ